LDHSSFPIYLPTPTLNADPLRLLYPDSILQSQRELRLDVKTMMQPDALLHLVFYGLILAVMPEAHQLFLCLSSLCLLIVPHLTHPIHACISRRSNFSD